MSFIITFIVLSVINVIFSTVRSILTIKGGKVVASLISGGYFAFYNVMLLFTVADFPMWQKCIITFACNVLGVYIVKLIEDKMRKEKLWKIETTFNQSNLAQVHASLKNAHIPHNYIADIGKHCIVNIYCETKEQSNTAKAIIKQFDGKYFASETKLL